MGLCVHSARGHLSASLDSVRRMSSRLVAMALKCVSTTRIFFCIRRPSASLGKGGVVWGEVGGEG